MNYKELAENFWKDGYLVIEDFFEPRLMDQYQQLILQNFGLNPEFLHDEEFLSRSATEVIPWFPQREDVKEFDVVENDTRLMALSQAILGDDWYTLYAMCMFSKDGTIGQAWHMDCPPGDPAVFNLNRLVYTEDILPEFGGEIVLVPGSHRRGHLSVGPVNEDFADQLVVAPKKGMLILLHGHTWHRVKAINGKYRISTNYRAAPKGTPVDVTDIAVYRNIVYQFSTGKVIKDRLA